MSFLELVFAMTKLVEDFVNKAKKYYYRVALLSYCCTKCNGLLDMYAESRCQCRECEFQFDPTVEFQTCPDCCGKVILLIRRHHCQSCGRDINSKFTFDNLMVGWLTLAESAFISQEVDLMDQDAMETWGFYLRTRYLAYPGMLKWWSETKGSFVPAAQLWVEEQIRRTDMNSDFWGIK